MSETTRTLNAGSRQIWLRIGVPILALVIAITSGALAISWTLAQRLDRDWVQDTQQLVRGAMAGNTRALSNTTMDFAFWNDAYRATSLRWDQNWLARNYFSAIADGMVVFRADGQIRYTWFSEDSGLGAETAAIVRNAGSAADLRGVAAETAASKLVLNGFSSLNQELVLISAAPISWETEKERLAGRAPVPVDYVATIDRIDAAEWTQIGQSLGLDGLTFRQGALNAQESGALVWSPVRDRAGNVLGGFVWRNERPGTSRFAADFWPIAFGVLLAGLCTILIVRRLVSRQLELLAHAEATVEASRLKSEFIATMSHELRTPLNAIIGYSELIHEQADEDTIKDADTREDAAKIGGAAQHLLRLINEVLDHARIDSGLTPLELEQLDVSHVLTEAMEVVEPLALARNNSVRMVIQDDAGDVIADPARLSQCLLNMIGNAVKFTKDGEIEISARRVTLGDKDYVAFDVKDTGIGIEKSVLETLFTPFSQGDGSDSRNYQGAGLGLSITRRLARAMSGDVTAISTPGKGSTFRLLIPSPDKLRRVA